MKLKKLDKVIESFTVNRYDNGFIIEVSDRDKNNDWVTRQILCSSEEISSRGLFNVIKEALSLTVAY